MSSVTHLTQHLLKLDPGKNVARQTLFNYLKVFVDQNAPLSAELFNQFFFYVLNYQYWQSNAKILGSSVQTDLEGFARVARLDFDLEKVRFPHRQQVVILDQTRDLEKLAEKREAKTRGEEDRSKLVVTPEQQVLVLTLKQAGGLEVRVYGRAAFVIEGELELTSPITNLHYTSNLELNKDSVQLLEGPTVTAARFKLSDDGCQGVMVRGHMLQRYETLNSGGLAQHAELFYGLKRVERHFINPVSDPYHREVLTSLERALNMLQSSHPEGKRTASAALQRGKAALKHIFPNDKALVILVTNIEYALMTQGPRHESTDPSQ